MFPPRVPADDKSDTPKPWPPPLTADDSPGRPPGRDPVTSALLLRLAVIEVKLDRVLALTESDRSRAVPDRQHDLTADDRLASNTLKVFEADETTEQPSQDPAVVPASVVDEHGHPYPEDSR